MGDKAKRAKILAELIAALSGLYPAPVQFIGPDGNPTSGPRVPQDVQDHWKKAIDLIVD